jgi:hypothetical protein
MSAGDLQVGSAIYHSSKILLSFNNQGYGTLSLIVKNNNVSTGNSKRHVSTKPIFDWLCAIEDTDDQHESDLRNTFIDMTVLKIKKELSGGDCNRFNFNFKDTYDLPQTVRGKITRFALDFVPRENNIVLYALGCNNKVIGRFTSRNKVVYKGGSLAWICDFYRDGVVDSFEFGDSGAPVIKKISTNEQEDDYEIIGIMVAKVKDSRAFYFILPIDYLNTTKFVIP